MHNNPVLFTTMRYTFLLFLVLALGLTGCGASPSSDDSYSYLNRGIGTTGTTLANPTDITATQDTMIVANHATITYWSPTLGWINYANSAEFLIVPGSTLHLGVTPNAGYYTGSEIIDIPYVSNAPTTVVVDVLKTVAN